MSIVPAIVCQKENKMFTPGVSPHPRYERMRGRWAFKVWGGGSSDINVSLYLQHTVCSLCKC